MIYCRDYPAFKNGPSLLPPLDELIDLICDICREKLDPADRFAFEAFAYYFDGYDNNNGERMATINKIRLAVVLIGILLIVAALISWYLRTH